MEVVAADGAAVTGAVAVGVLFTEVSVAVPELVFVESELDGIVLAVETFGVATLLPATEAVLLADPPAA